MRLVDSTQFPAQTRDPSVQAAMASVSEASLREWVGRISKPRHFRAQSGQNKATARWLAELLAGWKYDVREMGEYRNVIAIPRNHSGELELVGAHYDSVPETPGADDNGSAVAAMLACAEACARFARPRQVCFAAFNCEEDGMVGSADFARNGLSGQGIRILSAHILEMVGYADRSAGSQRLPTGLPIQIPSVGDFLGLLANGNSGAMMDDVLAQAVTYLPEFKVIGLEVPVGAEAVLPVLARSDHVPFWERNIPAVMWTDTSEFRNPNYHRSSDTPDTLDYGFLRLVAQLLVACVCAKTA